MVRLIAVLTGSRTTDPGEKARSSEKCKSKPARREEAESTLTLERVSLICVAHAHADQRPWEYGEPGIQTRKDALMDGGIVGT